jgi:hypothetical protein
MTGFEPTIATATPDAGNAPMIGGDKAGHHYQCEECCTIFVWGNCDFTRGCSAPRLCCSCSHDEQDRLYAEEFERDSRNHRDFTDEEIEEMIQEMAIDAMMDEMIEDD